MGDISDVRRSEGEPHEELGELAFAFFNQLEAEGRDDVQAIVILATPHAELEGKWHSTIAMHNLEPGGRRRSIDLLVKNLQALLETEPNPSVRIVDMRTPPGQG